MTLLKTYQIATDKGFFMSKCTPNESAGCTVVGAERSDSEGCFIIGGGYEL